MVIPVTSIPSHLLKPTLEKLNYREIFRLRQTCKDFDKYFEENLHHLNVFCPLELHITLTDQTGESIEALLVKKSNLLNLSSERIAIEEVPPIKFRKVVLNSNYHFLAIDFKYLKEWLAQNPIKCRKLNLWNIYTLNDLDAFFESFKNDSNLKYDSLVVKKMTLNQFYKISSNCKHLLAENYNDSLPNVDKIIHFESAAFRSLRQAQLYLQNTTGLLEKFMADQSCGNLKCFEFYGNLYRKESWGARKIYDGRTLQIHPMTVYLLEISPSTAILLEERSTTQQISWTRFYVINNRKEDICISFIQLLISPWSKSFTFFPRIVNFSELYECLIAIELEEWEEIVKDFVNNIANQAVAGA